MSHEVLEQDWRRIVLYGRNVASYKFALARALLQFGERGDDLVLLDDLAVPFANEIARHLKLADKQGTSKSSPFLEACRAYNRQEISDDQLRSKTVQHGFKDVIGAFHMVDHSDVRHRFFDDERAESRGIRLTDHFYRLVNSTQYGNLIEETESRWRLVETAWELAISPNLLKVDYNHEERKFFIDAGLKRVDITSARAALDGYQRGSCFYCSAPISIVPGDPLLADIDHFFPWILMSRGLPVLLDALWNLVLACTDCNRGSNGKFERMPTIHFVERLHKRNEWLIKSHKPLRETLFKLAGRQEKSRKDFLFKVYSEATQYSNPIPWDTPSRGPDVL
jgi:5-methylcytosine-specific restriction endonuclease McrA